MYYAVTGMNGFGIFDNYAKLIKGKEYIRKSIVKEFDDYISAARFAIDTYNDYQQYGDVDDIFDGSCFDLKKNWILYKRDIINLNRAAYAN